jgi:putative transposase
MYEYRHLTTTERKSLVASRIEEGYPWHSPPHYESIDDFSIFTAACYEHQRILNTPERLLWFENQLFEVLSEMRGICAAWCVLPNHYHVLYKMENMKQMSKGIAHLHGRTSFHMNKEDDARGRQVWCRFQDRLMRSERHYFTTLNYIHNNPVKHGYVKKWQEWPFSSAHWYLAEKGRDWLVDVWLEYPVHDYGRKWDL